MEGNVSKRTLVHVLRDTLDHDVSTVNAERNLVTIVENVLESTGAGVETGIPVHNVKPRPILVINYNSLTIIIKE